MKKGKVLAVNISESKGTRKKNIGRGDVLEGFGLKEDAHGGSGHRQVSLLAEESVQKIRERGLDVDCGDFAENITTRGLNLVSLSVGARLRIGSSVVLEVSQIGKECHTRCSIYYQAGDCVMPTEGIFAKVISGGPIAVGDVIELMEDKKKS